MRRLPPPVGIRILQALSLWLFVVTAARLVARLTLGYRHEFSLEADGRQMILRRARCIWGRQLRSSTTVLPIDRLQEITLEKRGESPAFTAGLAALVLGTFLGARFFVEGARAPGGAPWLWGLGLVLIVSSLGLDYFVGSGKTPKDLPGKPQVVLRLTGERGWVLTGLSLSSAQALVEAVTRSLSSGDDLTLMIPASGTSGDEEGESSTTYLTT